MKMSPVDFIIACEDGSLTQEEFEENAQRFVDLGIWRQLQGSWQRTVYGWAEEGLVTIN